MANDTINYQTSINSATDVNRTKVSADGYNDASDEENKSANNIEALADRLIELGQKMSNVWTDEAGQAHIRENNNLAQLAKANADAKRAGGQSNTEAADLWNSTESKVAGRFNG